MTLTESIKTCFQKYIDFSGRASRSEFWWFVLFTFVASVALSVMGLAEPLLIFLQWIFSLLVLLPSLAVMARRLHDTNRTAWWLLLHLVSGLGVALGLIFVIVALGFAYGGHLNMWGGGGEDYDGLITGLVIGAIISLVVGVGCAITLLVFFVLPGTVGPNRYGPDPLRPEQVMGGYRESLYDSKPAEPLPEQDPDRPQFCPQCGMQLKRDAQFCAACGAAN